VSRQAGMTKQMRNRLQRDIPLFHQSHPTSDKSKPFE
jgi:hypothetical protein